MKVIVVVIAAAVVVFIGGFVAVLDFAHSRAQMKAYGAQFGASPAQSALQGGAIVLLAVGLIALVVMLERRSAARVGRRRHRRRRHAASSTGSRTAAPFATTPPHRASAPAVAAAEPAIVPAAPRESPVTPASAPAIAPTATPTSGPAIVAPEAADDATSGVVFYEHAASPAESSERGTSRAESAERVTATGETPRRWTADPLRHWGLREPAFDNAPNARFLYRSPAHAEALFRLRYAIVHRKGGAILTGNYGCGKTTLARALAAELDRARFDVALIANPILTATELLRELLRQLGETAPQAAKPELLHRLQARLVDNLQRGRDTVLIVDEAQMIEDEAVFNELRLLLNFQTNDRFLLTLVLAGSEELRASMRRHSHLAQRCAVRANLGPLDREQTGLYVRHRLETAGGETETLTADAVDELYAATGGTPRVINAVCDLTLYVGAASGARRIDRELVRRVAGDVVPARAA